MKSNTCKVTIIVPMYNVERYIGKCIESIINQTVSDIEILLVNDGSPDESGKIADDFANKDLRISVIHTVNQGVSAARNEGLAIASGNYVTFVDGDDYLEPDCLEHMLKTAEITAAEFVILENCYNFPSEYKEQVVEIKCSIWSSLVASTNLLYPGRIEIGCWNKLYNREFLNRNRILFTTNIYMGEGLKFIVSCAQFADKIGVSNRKVYNYRKDNPDSATTVINVDKYINAVQAIDDIRNSLINYDDYLLKTIDIHRTLVVQGAVHAILAKKLKFKYHKKYSEYIRIIRKNISIIIFADLPMIIKIKTIMFGINPNIFIFLHKVIKGRN